jgi:hypothetical protein
VNAPEADRVLASLHYGLTTSKGHSRANGISERESADQPNCEADQDIGHTLAHATAIPRANATATVGQTINDNRWQIRRLPPSLAYQAALTSLKQFADDAVALRRADHRKPRLGREVPHRRSDWTGTLAALSVSSNPLGALLGSLEYRKSKV